MLAADQPAHEIDYYVNFEGYICIRDETNPMNIKAIPFTPAQLRKLIKEAPRLIKDAHKTRRKCYKDLMNQ